MLTECNYMDDTHPLPMIAQVNNQSLNTFINIQLELCKFCCLVRDY